MYRSILTQFRRIPFLFVIVNDISEITVSIQLKNIFRYLKVQFYPIGSTFFKAPGVKESYDFYLVILTNTMRVVGNICFRRNALFEQI